MFLRNSIILGFVYVASAAIVLAHLQSSSANGGGPFAQGDWLVNLESGIVRRGIVGSMFLHFADFANIDVMSLVVGTQSVIVILIIGSLFAGALSAGLPDRLLLVLVSPLLVTFWAVDPAGAFRKEILGFLAFLPLLLPGKGTRAILAGPLVSILFAIAVIAHEGNAFLAPALIVAMYLRYGSQASARWLVVLCGLVAATALAGVVFAALNATVDDTTAMCAALTARGLAPDMCTGAIFWMGDTFGITWGVMGEMLANHSQTSMVITFAALLLPLGVAFYHAPRSRLWIGVGIVLFASFLPLYAVAVDWGRWMSMYVFSMAFITMITATNVESDWLHRPVPLTLFIPLLVISGFLGVFHYGGLPQPGFVPMLANLVREMVF